MRGGRAATRWRGALAAAVAAVAAAAGVPAAAGAADGVVVRVEAGAANRVVARAADGVVAAAPGDAALRGAAPPAPARPATLRDDRGRDVALPAVPRRIVSLLPSLTESVCALGACDRLVGTDRFSNAPERVRALPKLGGLDDPQIERIVALRPDLVLLSTSARAAPRLEALGLRVAAFRSDTMADVARSLRALAGALGDPAAAERALAAIDAELAAAAAALPAALRGARTYVEIDATPYAAGEASFLGATLTRLGLAHAVPAALGPFPKLNPEFVVRAAPTLVVASTENAAAMRGRPGWASIPALAQGRVCALPSERFELLVRPGPRVGEAARRLVDCLRALPPPVLARPAGEGDARHPLPSSGTGDASASRPPHPRAGEGRVEGGHPR